MLPLCRVTALGSFCSIEGGFALVVQLLFILEHSSSNLIVECFNCLDFTFQSFDMIMSGGV